MNSISVREHGKRGLTAWGAISLIATSACTETPPSDSSNSATRNGLAVDRPTADTRAPLQVAPSSTASSEAVLASPEGGAPTATSDFGSGGPDLATFLRKTATVVEGVVEDISYDYDKAMGPRTLYRFKRIETHLGKFADEQFTVNIFGGPLPDGTFVRTSELPELVYGGTYVLFLINEAWFYSPLVSPDLALRRETVQGKKILVDVMGRPVSAIGPSGIGFTGLSLFVVSVEPERIHDSPLLAAQLPENVVEGAMDADSFGTALKLGETRTGSSATGVFQANPTQELGPWRQK
jgi:hypothetical protein